MVPPYNHYSPLIGKSLVNIMRSTPTFTSVTIGPRAEKRHKECLKIATAEQKEKDQEYYSISRTWETTSSEGQKLAKSRIQKPSCIDIGHSLASGSEVDEDKRILFHSLYSNEAITHWSEKLKDSPPDFPLTSFSPSAAKPFFARSSAFTNENILNSSVKN